MMLLVHKLGYNVSYGAILAACIGYSVSVIISLIVLKRKYGFNFSDTRKKLPGFIISWIIFEISIILLRLIIPTNLDNRLLQIPIILVFGIVSFGIYLIFHYFNGNLVSLFNIKKKGKKK